MQLYPTKMRTAQAEIDSVVGTERMPNFSDHDQLTYVQALIKEVLRQVASYHMSFSHLD
jgi:hypothetical protein